MTILSTCCGLSRCFSTDLMSRLLCRKGTEITACCLPSWKRSSSPSLQVGKNKINLENRKSFGLRTAKQIYLVLCPVLAEQVWDPLSRSQTARLVEFLHRLRRGYPTVLHGDNKYTQVLPVLVLTEQTISNYLF